ncbi:MAG TPA: TonB-dependent receptor [Terriglobales bacterium]|nr:TonB-dependent receptor [Terriglobales bacterium]
MTDPSGAVIPGAQVTVLNVDTNVGRAIATDRTGTYSFRGLPVGTYEMRAEAKGFKLYRRTGIVLNPNDTLLIDVPLTLGPHDETVTVKEAPVRIETADTQLGEVISSRKISSVPLNGRSFTDLLPLQPGVAPATSITANSINAGGATLLRASGNLNPGTVSINGQREYANGFMVNDADVVERFTMGAAVIPNLDSIAEFRILTGNFDAEYGNYSGGRINVVTKSGTNQFHGSAFEFLRNTVLDARNYFSEQRAVYQQNQFGGALGGPVLRNKIFFFTDYQGTRMKRGVDSGILQVPSALERTGDFGAVGQSLTDTVSGPYIAQQLSQGLGYPVAVGENYYTPGCTSSAQCVFPNAIIPQAVWSTPAKNLLQYIPLPNLPDSKFSTSSQNELFRGDRGAVRIEGSSRWGMLSAYYFLDDYTLDNPYPGQGGANIPGFNALNFGRTQLLTLGDVKDFGSRSVNEFRFSYVRDVNHIGTPLGHVGTTLVSQGFVTAQGEPSILPQRPAIEGVENVIFNNFTMGSTVTGMDQTDNTFELRDNFSRSFGAHILKFGGEAIYSQVNVAANVQSNGTFLFSGTETGVDFADFLLGVASQYTQGDARPFYNRNKYGALFVQDTWRVHSRLTLNYGLRWDVIMPWYEAYNQIQTLVLGQQSLVYPTAPRGIVFPTDPGIGRSLAPTRWNNFSPRVGVAYSPSASGGLLGRLLGQDKTSIRAGFGRFFSAVEGVSIGVMAGDPPYGSTYASLGPPLFSNPFVTAATGVDNGQRFPLDLPPLNATANNPNPNVDWTQFIPINGMPGYDPRGKSPYSLQYTLTLQRQFGTNTLLTLGYVGSQAHHLIVLVPANPGNAELCLSLPGCGPFGEDATYTSASGEVFHGTRQPFGSDFAAVTFISPIGNSNYNAFETSLRYVSRRLEFLAGYTYSKSLDNGSSISEQLNPFDPRATYALSAFDVKHNFVFSYYYNLPLDRLFHTRNQLTSGWIFSGVTRFSSGFPVTLHNNSDRSLLGTQRNGVNNTWGVDLPQFTPGPLNLNPDPSSGLPYFNTALFSLQPLGEPGNAKPRFFYGPGMSNFDMALQKDVGLGESRTLSLRIEAFNAFNHPQFYGPASVNGNISSSTFGNIVSAASPRLLQVALHFAF